MKRANEQFLGGVLLVVGGFLLLLQNLGFLGGGELLWSLLFGLGGIAFIVVYVNDRQRWWALIPGGALLALAAPIALSVAGEPGARLGGPAFLAVLGLSFVAVYLSDQRTRWWAIIPGGVILTLASVAALGVIGLGEGGGAVFFLGLALTFFGVALLPHVGARRDWALYPAVGCLGLGMIVVAATTSAFTILSAVALIAVGVYLLYRTRRAEPW